MTAGEHAGRECGNLTLLSPAMVQRVLDGNEPEGWSVNGLGREVEVLW